MGTLFVVSTPIGNLEDISPRALRVLREVGLIAAEDTRHSLRLLNAFGIKTPLTSYHEHNRLTKLDYIIEQLAKMDVALISDAGMPGISDPGHELIVAARERGIPVVAIPGPSAIITAVAISGLPTERFLYLGFLPPRTTERRRQLEGAIAEKGSLVILEAPHRLQDTLSDLKDILGDRQIAVCRELTKLHEEVFRGSIRQAIEHFAIPRGEFVLVVDGNTEKPAAAELTESVLAELARLKAAGVPAREATAELAQETGLSRRSLYQAWLKLGKAL